jgi:hypothetical protein
LTVYSRQNKQRKEKDNAEAQRALRKRREEIEKKKI